MATSVPLTRSQKDRIYKMFRDWMPDTSYVLGAHDIDGLLTCHPHIERRYVKLWVTSGGVLETALRAATFERSAHLVAKIAETLPRYVESEAFGRALALLETHRVCIISGPPGIGKTTLATMLLAEAISEGYSPIEISHDIEEAWEVVHPRELQAFYYDDFLGRISLGERMQKNEDHRLAEFVRKVSRSKSKLLLLTTREYILEDARREYEELGRLDEKLKIVLQLRDYSRLDRAKILYNHLWHGRLARHDLDAIVQNGRYLQIIDHPNFSPRLIEHVTRPPITSPT